MHKLFDLTGRKAMVIGGAGGLGQAIATGLIQAGATVAIASRKLDSLRRAQDEIGAATGAAANFYVCNAAREDDVRALASKAEQELGGIDILVCSQGYNQKAPALEFDMNVWSEMFDANVKSVMICAKAFAGAMKRNGWGRIINLSSVRGRIATFPMAGNTAYCATKGAVDMLTRQLAAELGPEVTVNALGPTVTATPMMEKFLPPDAKAHLSSIVPLKRMATPEDCVGAAIFLASEAASYVTGQILYVDGGLTAIG